MDGKVILNTLLGTLAALVIFSALGWGFSKVVNMLDEEEEQDYTTVK